MPAERRRATVRARARHERSWVVKIGISARKTSRRTAVEQPEPTGSVDREEMEEESTQEAFEATILRLDSATAEMLFRMAEE